MKLEQYRFAHLKVDVQDDGIAVVKINRPERRNAINPDLHDDLTMLPLVVAEDPDVKVLVLTGEGTSFSAGGDVSEFQGWGSADVHQLQGGRRLVDNYLSLEKPVLAAVNGYAVGLGASLALLADVVVVGPASVISDPHVKMGLAPGDGGALLWPLLMGPMRAKWYLMTGEKLKGRELVDNGLATFYCSEDDQILSTTLEKASLLAAGAQQALAGAKSAVNQLLRHASTLVMPLALSHEIGTLTTADHAEAVRAFAENRVPVFGGQQAAVQGASQ